MNTRPLIAAISLAVLALAALLATAGIAWAESFGWSETKAQKAEFKLDYKVSAVDDGGRVAVILTIADAGRLKPLTAVELVVPSKDGTDGVDLALRMGTRTVDGKMQAAVQLNRELAERAEIHLQTRTLDGKRERLSWYFYTIPVANHLKDPAPK